MAATCEAQSILGEVAVSDIEQPLDSREASERYYRAQTDGRVESTKDLDSFYPGSIGKPRPDLTHQDGHRGADGLRRKAFRGDVDEGDAILSVELLQHADFAQTEGAIPIKVDLNLKGSV